MGTHKQTTPQEEVLTNTDALRPPWISWGAVFAGLVLVIAGGWLLYTLGAGIGVSITDATNAQAIGNGLGIGAAIWMILSTLIVLFLGAMLTARLAGYPAKSVGIFHGVTLWSAATVCALLFAWLGFTTIVQAGYAVTKDTAKAAASVTSGVASGAASAAQSADLSSLANTSLGNKVQARLKREAAKAIASDSQGNVSQSKARSAIKDLTPKVLSSVAVQLITGNPQGAKNVLTARTSLSDNQVNSIVDAVQSDVQSSIDKYKKQASQAVEAASTYAQALTWTTFAAGALGLVVSILGGLVGSVTIRRRPVAQYA